jgi:Uma2 family endonuclease
VRKESIMAVENMADLMELRERLGNVPFERILLKPLPGTATERDAVRLLEGPEKRICELIDGVLVEKAVATNESLLAMQVGRLLGNHVDSSDMGVILGEAGLLRLEPGLVRAPDVSFIAWDNIPDREMPTDAIAPLAPDLAVEVLSKKNTAAEIDRKLRDYFLSGTKLAWVIDPKTQTAKVYTSPVDVTLVGKRGSLDGGGVVPGFRLSLADLFSRLKQRKKK